MDVTEARLDALRLDHLNGKMTLRDALSEAFILGMSEAGC